MATHADSLPCDPLIAPSTNDSEPTSAGASQAANGDVTESLEDGDSPQPVNFEAFAPLVPLGEDEGALIQEERKQLEAYTHEQLAGIKQQREAFVAQQTEIEKKLLLQQQELNRQKQSCSAQIGALQKREKALVEREAALTRQREELNKDKQELSALYQNREQALAERESVLATQRDRLRKAHVEVAALETTLANFRKACDKQGSGQWPVIKEQHSSAGSGVDGKQEAPDTLNPLPTDLPPSIRQTKAQAETLPDVPGIVPFQEAIAQDPAPSTSLQDFAASRPAASSAVAIACAVKPETKPAKSVRWGNPISVLISRTDATAEPLPGWVVGRSTDKLYLSVGEAVEVGAILAVRPAESATFTREIPVQVKSCHWEKCQWRLGCHFLAKLPWSDLQQFG